MSLNRHAAWEHQPEKWQCVRPIPLKLPVNALKTGFLAEILTALQKGVSYLATNAQRAHPKRDRRSGAHNWGSSRFFNNKGNWTQRYG
jgi:hypothetical protein